MTYKEWITKTVGKFQLSADDVDLILCNQSGLIPDPDAPVDVRKAKTAICREFTTLIPLANIDGKLSVSNRHLEQIEKNTSGSASDPLRAQGITM